MDQVKIPQFDRAGVKRRGSPKSTASRPLLLNPGMRGRQSICCSPCHHAVLGRRRWTISHDAWSIHCASLWSTLPIPKMLCIEKEMVHDTHLNPWGVNKGLIYTELDHGLHNSVSPFSMHSQRQLCFISAQQWAHTKLSYPSLKFNPCSPWWFPSSSKSSKIFWRGTQ